MKKNYTFDYHKNLNVVNILIKNSDLITKNIKFYRIKIKMTFYVKIFNLSCNYHFKSD